MCSQSLLYYLLAVLMGMEVLIDRHILLLVMLGPVKRYFPFHSHKDVPREEVLKVLTYNVMAFGYKNHTKIAPNKIIQYIANSDADIVCLQEYATAKSEKSLTASKIYDALSMYPYRSVFYQSSTKFQSFGIAVFSKYPLSNSRMVKYDSDYTALPYMK